MRERVQDLVRDHGEDGHAAPLVGALVAGAGAILLGIGAAADTGWLAIAGGVIAALGLAGYDFVRHVTIDKEFFRRTDKA